MKEFLKSMIVTFCCLILAIPIVFYLIGFRFSIPENSSLDIYNKEFIKEAKKRNIKLPWYGTIVFPEGTSELHSICAMNYKIMIVPSKISRRALFHELGHCALGLEHDFSETNGIPNSYMMPYTGIHYKEVNFEKNQDHYINKLFEDTDL